MAEQIKCLGKSFTSDDERREYYRDELRKLLPELKKIDGFPIGEDEDIIELSDPPYYTACPNPWLNDFIIEWENEKANQHGRKDAFHVNEPYSSDVSEGKNNPIFNGHSYHTKVPHPAIMRYILHYTQPGDIVFDGFAGTGMAGVAAQCCAAPDANVKSEIEKDFNQNGLKLIWGPRKAIISDLAPIATFISSQYNRKLETDKFGDEFYKVFDQAIKKYSWLYETKHKSGGKGKINYTVWSEVFSCPFCECNLIFYEVAFDSSEGKMLDSFTCTSCKSNLNKADLNRLHHTIYDSIQKKTIQQNKYVPVLINYSVGKRRYEKKPDAEDLKIIERAQMELNSIDKKELSSYPMMFVGGEGWGDIFRTGYHYGITHTHHFYTDRNLLSIAYLWNSCNNPHIKWILTSILNYVNKKQSYTGGGGGMPGVFYIASLVQEKNVFDVFKRKAENIIKLFKDYKPNQNNSLISTSSANSQMLNNSSVDYIFVDPPFGSNIMYSEGSFLWESWLKVFTNNKMEAIENKSQNKNLISYNSIMSSCFSEFYRILKPGKWMTVEFSNTSASVWNGIQTSIQRVGFIIANVSALDKKQGGFKGVTTPTAVQQDLVISCYKPSSDFENKFNTYQGDKVVWDFISEHLRHLPIHIKKESNTTVIIERSPKILFDRLITFYLMRGLPIPIDAKDFQEGLKQRFIERDGMFFIDEQVIEYDDKKANAPNVIQVSWQIATESEGVEWLKRELKNKPLKYQDIQPKWMQAITAIRKGDILPELRDLLQQNFIEESGGFWRVPDLNEATDREFLRNKILIREFDGYIEIANNPKAKKMKEVRVEALRAGFKSCWETKDFEIIIRLSEKIPQNLLLEDEQLLMYYDIAKDKV